MNLLIDIGNTSAKAVLDDGLQFTPVKLSVETIQTKPISNVFIAAVGDSLLLSEWQTHFNKRKIPVTLISSEKERFGVKNIYLKPQTLGVDRWLALIASHHLYQNQFVLIVDSGTALTIDGLSPDGKFLGGWIIPGQQLMLDSVLKHTQKVFDGKLQETKSGFGSSTPECLKLGCVYAHIGAVHSGIRELRSLSCTEDELVVVFAGGNGKYLFNEFSNMSPDNIICYYESDLIFLGIRAYANEAIGTA